MAVGVGVTVGVGVGVTGGVAVAWSWATGVHIPFCNLTCDGSSAVADINAENCLVVVEGGGGSCIGAARSPWDRGLVVFPLVDKVFPGRCHTKRDRLSDDHRLVLGLNNDYGRRSRVALGSLLELELESGLGLLSALELRSASASEWGKMVARRLPKLPGSKRSPNPTNHKL